MRGVSNSLDVTVIGAAVMDILAGAVGPEVFETGSMPMEYIRTSYGGDALNEAVVLSKLGKKVELITRLGDDDVGARTMQFLRENGVKIQRTTVSDEYPSSVNIVLVDEEGERYFLTDPKSCLRKLSEDDIIPHIEGMADIVSFASIFVSPRLRIANLERIFKQIKENVNNDPEEVANNPEDMAEDRNKKNISVNRAEKKRILLTDITKPKNGERIEDIACLLPYIDYFLANEDEIAMLTGVINAAENARLLVEEGANCVVIKRGKKGCIIKTKNEMFEVPAYKVENAIDSTGAGDGFAAGFLYGLSEGYSLQDCGKLGCAVASCIVENVGGSEGIDSIEEPRRRFDILKDNS